MKRGWIVASLCFLALFVFTIWQSLSLPLLDELGPGPGFFPLWLALLGAVLALVLTVETVRSSTLDTGESLIPDRPAMFRVLSIVVSLAAAAAALEMLGWRITATLLSAVLLVALGARSPLIVVPFAIVAGFGVFHVFYYWLKVPLPIGTFGI
ncbi:MAG: tripartite tricarboxylate transporter TctB family protein [Hyphomicrobiaceae bacterium]